jgi:two-component system, chemotaxis family, sensor kinase CheA
MESFSAGEFLQGFLEEAGEHLQLVNQNLLRLEQINGGAVKGASSEAVMERIELFKELFRSFHTLKGLSGMVGLKEAVTLSHALEHLLLELQQGRLEFTQQLIDGLFSGTSVLAGVVESLRKPDLAMPEIEGELEKIKGLTERSAQQAQSTPGAAQAAGEVTSVLPGLASYASLLKTVGALEMQKITTAVRAGHTISLVIFAPSEERAERGENVDLVRQQIKEVGSLIKAVPDMQDGRIRFLFLLETAQPLGADTVIADEVISMAAVLPEQAVNGAMNAAAQRGNLDDLTHATMVRVELDRLDEMIRCAGTLMLLRSRLVDTLGKLENVPSPIRRELKQTTHQISRTLRDLRRSVLRARMVPLAEVFNHMPLVARDLARSTQKEIRLVVQGEETELDKLLVERLLEPLIHLMRNAIIHGIETPDARAAAGKDRQGRLTLRGIPQGDHIFVEVSDDGRGVNLEQVAEKAAAAGLLAYGERIDPEQALELIARPGFSTYEAADEGAGRGIGLDVVMKMVHQFGGRMSLETTSGAGSTFRLRLPLTLVILDVLLVRVGQEQYAVPRNSISRIYEIDAGQVVRTEGGELVAAGQGHHVLFRLSDLIQTRQASNGADRLFGLVIYEDDRLESENQQVVVVDQVLDLREVVVQTVTDSLVAKPGISGATELSNGAVVLILDLPVLLRLAAKG